MATSVVSSPTSSIKQRRYRFATEVVTVDNPDDPHNAASVPIYQSATFKQTGAGGGGDYDYSRSGNPTRTQLGKDHLLFYNDNAYSRLMRGYDREPLGQDYEC